MTDIPLYLGLPSSSTLNYLEFDKLGIMNYYAIVPPKIDHYVMYAVLDNGQRVDVDVNDLRMVTYKIDPLQIAIDARFAISRVYIQWLKILIPFTEKQFDKHKHFLIGVKYDLSPIPQETLYWCPRWPTEGEVQSMVKYLHRFAIKYFL